MRPIKPHLDSITITTSGRRVRGHLLALAFLSLAAGDRAAAYEANGTTPAATFVNPLGDDELVIDEVFQSHLPTTLKKYSFRLSVHPHLGDLQHKDYLRMSTSIRYGLTDHCELSADSDLYFSHGLRNIRAFDRYGAANLDLGIKLNLGQFLFSGWDTAAGADYEFPLGRPPAALTDGLRHLRSYATFSHRLAAHPLVRVFVGFRLDDITKTSLRGEFGKNAFHVSSAGITGGWVVDRGNLHYTFEASYDSTRLISSTKEDIYTIRPGVIWEIPTRRDPQVISHWMVGVALNDTYGPGGNSLGASFKLRYSRDLKDRRHHHQPVAVTP